MFCRKCGGQIPDDSEFCPKKLVINKRALIIVIAAAAIAAAAIFVLVSISAWREAHHEFEYHLADGGYVIDKYLGDSGNVAIPDTINRKPVMGIAERAFAGSGVWRVTFGKNITDIGAGAFEDCVDLSWVWFSTENKSESLTIGDNAFSGCSSLSYLDFPYNPLTFGSGAFEGCSSLISVPFDHAKVISERAFAGCGIDTLYLYGAEIAKGAFADCVSLTYAYILGTIELAPELFSNCEKLEIVSWSLDSYNDTVVGEKAFSGCSALSEIRCKDGDESLELYSEKELKEFNSSIRIDSGAFDGCRNFGKMTFRTILNDEGFYEDMWDYVFYDDLDVHGEWETIGYVWSEELEAWKEGNARLRTGETYVKNVNFSSDGTAVLTISSSHQNYRRSAVWSRGYVYHRGVKAPTINAVSIYYVDGVEYLVFEHKNASYNIRKLVDIYFILKRTDQNGR